MDTTPGPDPVDDRPDRGEGVLEGEGGLEGEGAVDSGGAVESVDSGGAVDVDGDSPDDEGRDPLRFNHWMKRSATGAVLTGITLGLREALEPRREEPAIMIEAAGEPEDPDQPIVLHFDPDSPADTVAVIRRPTTGPTDGGDPPAQSAPPR